MRLSIHLPLVKGENGARNFRSARCLERKSREKGKEGKERQTSIEITRCCCYYHHRRCRRFTRRNSVRSGNNDTIPAAPPRPTGGLRCATTTTHRSQTLSEEACSNALNKSNFLAKTFGLPARGRGATIVPTTVFSRNGRSLRHIGTQRSLRESPPSVRTSVQTRQDRREREKEIKGEGERRRRREGRGDSFRSP